MNHEFLDRPYNRDEFLKFVQNFLPDFKYKVTAVAVGSTSLFNGVQTLGTALSGQVTVLEIIANPAISGKRIAITKEAFQILRTLGEENALIAFSTGENEWRLSLLTTTLKLEKGKLKSEASNPRRYSYLLGASAKTKTPQKSFKDPVADLNDLKTRFSLEVVNKEFYNGIAKLFAKLVGGDYSKTHYNGELKINGRAGHNQAHQEFAVRLIGRLVFCWFLKEKKSENGKSLIPNELLSSEMVAGKTNYYHDILEPLFYETLNQKITRRKGVSTEAPFDEIPYLNGGLFSPQKGDSGDHYEFDPVLGIGHYGVGAKISNDWFKELFELLSTYNFTVDENTSYDVDLSIDPEMLGRIFENLLAEINPETGESARNATGSFYTPREIVDYMVDSSLIEFLKTKTDISEQKLSAIVSYGTDDDEENPLTDMDKKKIVEALSDLSILDPACGSGAFPIGILQKVVYILQQVDSDGKLWLEKQLAGNADPGFRKFLERQNYDYIRKLGVIRESIFGVDIQPIATEIARLRCFLTLIVEETVDDVAENRGIQPLPNLEFKFVTANSLVGLNESETAALGDEKLSKLENKLFNLRAKEYFQTKTSDEKKSLQKRDDEMCKEILLETAGVVGVDEKSIQKQEEELQVLKKRLLKLSNSTPHTIKITRLNLFGETITSQEKTMSTEEKHLKKEIQLIRKKIKDERKKSSSPILINKLRTIIRWNPYNPGMSAEFFSPGWMFGMDKFDIVIANPPYIHLEKMDNEAKAEYQKQAYETYTPRGDIYALFYERGIELLADGGLLTFITSNKWMRAGYGKALRDYFVKNTQPIQLIDLGSGRFSSATVDTNILTVQKGENKNKLNAVTYNESSLENMSDYVKQNSVAVSYKFDESWTILSPIEQSIKQKIEAVGVPLKDWDIKINRGILTGCNEAFIIDEKKRNELIAQGPKSAEIIRPILRGRDIKRNEYNFANLYLIATHDGYTDSDGNYVPRIKIDAYSAVKMHLDSYWDKISVRTDMGETPYNLRSCAYMDDFSKQKIIFPAIMTGGAFFALDDDNHMIVAPGNIIVGENTIGLESFLISPVCYFALRNFYMGGGIEGELKVNRLFLLPVPKFIENREYSGKEILKIYGLTDEEIKFISSSVKLNSV